MRWVGNEHADHHRRHDAQDARRVEDERPAAENYNNPWKLRSDVQFNGQNNGASGYVNIAPMGLAAIVSWLINQSITIILFTYQQTKP